jgi:oligopeptide transport system substrate-binding protein
MKKTFLVALVLAVSACTGSKEKDSALRMRLPSEPPTIDWSLATDNISKEVIVNIQEGLVQQDGEAKPLPGLAESWTISPDGKTYTFQIRDGVTWSDGKPLTAQHFIDSWERVLNPKTASEYAYFLFDLVNAEAYQAGKVTDFSQVGAKAVSDKVLEVTLNAPVSYWINIVAFWISFPIRKDVVAAHGDRWTDPANIVTVGPYLLKEWVRDSKIVLEQNPNYYDKALLKTMAPKVEFRVVKDGSVAVTLFDTGDLDIVRDLPPVQLQMLAQKPEFKSALYLRGTYIGFNVKDPALKDPRVRRALAHAVDRSEIAKALFPMVTETNSWIPDGLIGSNSARGLGFDPEKAKALWKELGAAAPKELELWYDQNERYKILAENVQNQWTRVLGVPVKLNSQEWKVYLKSLDAEKPPALFRLGWGADYPDPDTFMNLFRCKSGNNKSRFCSARFDQLIGEASRSTDSEARAKAYDEAQKILLEDDPAILPVFTEKSLHLVSQRVIGFKSNPIGDFLLKNLQIK